MSRAFGVSRALSATLLLLSAFPSLAAAAAAAPAVDHPRQFTDAHPLVRMRHPSGQAGNGGRAMPFGLERELGISPSQLADLLTDTRPIEQPNYRPKARVAVPATPNSVRTPAREETSPGRS